MASCLLLEYDVEVPLDVRGLDGFRHWASSDAFPESGRIDFINGNIEIDMSPENAFTHSTPKNEIVRVLGNLLKHTKAGYLFSDRMRCSSAPADLSVEPDVVFVSNDAVRSGRVRLIQQKGGGEHDFVEIEGSPDVAVEVVSKSSVAKDTERLPRAYFKAGVREFWLLDARGQELLFVIHSRGQRRFEPAMCDDEGFQRSEVFDRRFRLDRERDELGNWIYDLRVEL